MKLNQKGFIGVALLVLVLAIIIVVGFGYVFLTSNGDTKEVSSEMLTLRTLNAELIKGNPVKLSEIDKGCEEDLSIYARPDRQTCTTRIRSVFSGQTTYDELKEFLSKSETWRSASVEKYASEYKGLEVCVTIAKARIDFETENVNSEVTISTLKDDMCYETFRNLESSVSKEER